MSTTQKKARSGQTVTAFRKALEDNLYYARGQAIQSASFRDAHMALAYTVRDQLVERWHKTTNAHFEANPKFVYYLSAEYLLGRQLTQNIFTSLGRLPRKLP